MVPVDNQHDEMARLSSLMQYKMEERPKLLSPSAGRKECCIFRVHQELGKINEEAYCPRLVSIGPYHHGKIHLQMLEEHKWRFLRSLLDQSQVNLQELIDAISPEEEKLRESYSECIDKFSWSELVMMMALDGCFIIEFLLRRKGLVECNDDPIVNIAWIAAIISTDLFKLENQIPYFILEKLFQITQPSRNGSPTLASLVKNLFKDGLHGPSAIVDYYIGCSNCQRDPTKHLLDLYWKILVMPISDSNPSTSSSPFPHVPIVIHSTQMLRQAGIKFRVKESTKSFLEISFNKGTIEIPLLRIYDSTCPLLANLIAFEQYYSHHPKVITTYAVFMDFLINSSVDSEYLQSKQIINSYIGTHEEVGRFFNQSCKNVAVNNNEFYLRAVCEGINDYTANIWHAGWGGIKHKYFGAPWAGIAALGALLGLLLTATQTVMSVLGYVNLPK